MKVLSAEPILDYFNVTEPFTNSNGIEFSLLI